MKHPGNPHYLDVAHIIFALCTGIFIGVMGKEARRERSKMIER